MDGRKVGIVCGLAALLSGCGSRPELAYPDWLRSSGSTPSAQGRYAAYVSAAELAEKAAPKYLSTVYFTPGKRDACLKQIGPALRMLSQGAQRQELGWGFTPTSPLASPDHVAGWRVLGRGLVWKIEEGVRTGDHEAAVRCTVLATRFGYDLLGGGAMEGSLGLALCDDARRAIAPAIPKLSGELLEKLSSGVGNVLARSPKLTETISNERLNLLAGVQAIQDAYREEAWGNLVKGFGPDVRAAVDRLKEMKSKDPAQAINFFKGLADEAEDEAEYYARLAQLPRARRSDIDKPDLDQGRPWRRFARHCTGTLRPLLDQYDDTLARTRLLVLEAELQQRARAGEPFPKTISQFGAELATDPFSGESFPYRADGTDYRVYSVGSDLSDDGGQTDETFAMPDVRLEKRG